MSAVSILTVQPLRGLSGPTVQHLSFMRALCEAGFACHAVIPDDPHMRRMYAEVAASVSALRETPSFPRSLSPTVLQRYARRTLGMSKEIQAIGRRVDARLVHSFGESFPAALLAGRVLRLPTAVHVIGMTIFSPPYVGLLYGHLLHALSSRLIGCQEVITGKLKKLGVPASKLRVVYNGIDVDAVRECATRPVPAWLPSGLKVGMVACMDRRKGHLLFVRAAARVLREMPETHLFLIGDTTGEDEYLAEIRAEIAQAGIAQRVHLTGRVDRVEPYIQAMDVYCVPSFTEALSVAGLEAMALARPLVATNVDGNPIVVVDGKTGLLSRPRDPEDMARKIIVLLRDEALRRRMGEQARLRVQDMFTIQRNGARLAEVFTELLQERASRATGNEVVTHSHE